MRNVYYGGYCTAPTIDINPCNASDGAYSYYYGETWDYLANIVAAPPCSGTPTAGSASATATTGCGPYTTTVSLSGYTIASGITLQWQSSPTGTGSWTNIAGATNNSFSTTVSSGIYFRCNVSCSSGGSTPSVSVNCANTATYTVATVPFFESFEGAWTNMCATKDKPVSGHWLNYPSTGPSSWRSDNTTVAASGWASVSGAYTPAASVGSRSARFHTYDYVASPAPGNLDLHINMSASGTYQISYNFINPTSYGDGLRVYLSTNGGTSFTLLDNVTTASSWTSRVLYSSDTSSDAILRFQGHGSDEYSDDVGLDSVYVKLLPNCSGTPTAGTTVVSTGLACSSATINLSLTGSTIGVSGIQYQWQRRDAGTGTWTDIAGATTETYNYTGQTVASDYYAKVTCPYAGSTVVSSVATVLEGACVCTPSYVYSTGDYTYAMNNFALVGYSGSTINDAGVMATAGYADRTSAVPAINLQQNGTYSGTIDWNYSYYLYDQVYIDFNDDGVFQTSEAVTGIIGAGMSCGTTTVLPYTMTIPLLANPGIHRMRVRDVYSTSYCTTPGQLDPCNPGDGTYSYDYGETWDYEANIIALPPCVSTPAAGTANSTVSYACNTTSIGLSLTGYSTAAGLTFQWQSSPTGASTWSDISGATSTSFVTSGQTATTDYRCVVTCSFSSGTANSVLVTVNQSPCYCTTVYYYTTGDYYEAMTNVNIIGYGGTSINDNGPMADAGYADRTSAVPAMTMLTGGTYSGTMSMNYGYDMDGQVWIDFNDDGTFATSEEVTPSFGYAGTTATFYTFTVTIPSAAPVGYHRMRARSIYQYTITTPPTHIDPCASTEVSGGTTCYNYEGETWDYEINIRKSTITETGTLANFGNIIVGTSSAGQSFSIAGSYLTPVSGNLTVTPPTGFQVSSDSASWFTSAMNVPYTSGTLGTTAIYARATPVTGGVGAGNIVIAGGGATSVNVAVADTAFNPVITATPTSLTSFGSVLVGTSSAYESYNLSATGLFPATGSLTVTAPAGFGVSSTTGGTYTTSITVPYSGGALSSTPVYVEFMPTITGVLSDTVRNTGGSALNSAKVAVNGNGVIPGLAVTPTTTNFGPQILSSTTVMSFSLSGTYLTGGPGTISLSSSDGQFLISTDSMTWSSTASVPYTTATLAATPVYVQFIPTATGAQVSYITMSGGGVSVTPIDTAIGSGINFCGAPSNQPSAVACSSPTSTGGTIGVTPYSTHPDGYVLVASLYPNTFSGTFTDGTSPAVGSVVGSGSGAGTVLGYYTTPPPFTFTGLSSNTQYYITVIPYNASGGCSGSPFYFGTGALYDQITTCPGVTGTPSGSSISSSGFTINWTAPTGGATNYTVNVYHGGTPISGSPFTASSTSQVIAGLTMNTNYTYTVIANNGSCSGATSATGNTTTNCANPTIVSTPSAAATCSGTNATFAASGAGTGGTYTWSPATSLSATTGASVVANPTTTRTYTVTGTNSYGCSSTATAIVNVNDVGAIAVTAAPTTVCTGGSTTLIAAVAGSTPTTILTQNFNSGIGTWTESHTGTTTLASHPTCIFGVKNVGGSYDGGAITPVSNDGTKYIMADADTNGSGLTTWTIITSPTFSLAGYASASLSFYHYYEYYSSGDVLTNVEISIDGGTTWNLIKNYKTDAATVGAPTAFAHATFNLSAYIGNSTLRQSLSVTSRFRYSCLQCQSCRRYSGCGLLCMESIPGYCG